MEQQKKYQLLAEIFDEPVESLTADTEIDSLIFDSVARMALMAMLSEKFEKRIGTAQLKGFKKLQDILNLMQEQ